MFPKHLIHYILRSLTKQSPRNHTRPLIHVTLHTITGRQVNQAMLQSFYFNSVSNAVYTSQDCNTQLKTNIQFNVTSQLSSSDTLFNKTHSNTHLMPNENEPSEVHTTSRRDHFSSTKKGILYKPLLKNHLSYPKG